MCCQTISSRISSCYLLVLLFQIRSSY
uniref:ABCF1 n=1 Tax=Arundo donax TaxID=35708 RepID=A0A0A9DT31_ARUDO